MTQIATYSGKNLNIIGTHIGRLTNATLGALALHCIKMCSICQKQAKAPLYFPIYVAFFPFYSYNGLAK